SPVDDARCALRRGSLAALGTTGLFFAAALPAQAADIQGHAISYQITVEKPPAETKAEGQMSASLSKTCESWDYSSALLYSLGRTGARMESWQEGTKFSEKPDGRTLQYEARYRVGARGEEARGTVALGADGAGTLDVKSDKLPRKVDLPAGTLLPVALRAKLIDALGSSDPDTAGGPFALRTIELGRFYAAADVTVARAAALPALKPPAPRVNSPLLRGRAWTLKQTSKALSDWMESTFELHESGVIARFTFRREGIVWRADVKELNAFATPKCGG
ncbi:EipB family protein, partial [Vineibacter terrae]|uniref:EipB family protein n=1 Tax=Vineibacter terrae TaxID=2586908 RepID=UPI002E330EDF